MDPLGPQGDISEPAPSVFVSAGSKRKPIKPKSSTENEQVAAQDESAVATPKNESTDESPVEDTSKVEVDAQATGEPVEVVVDEVVVDEVVADEVVVDEVVADEVVVDEVVVDEVVVDENVTADASPENAESADKELESTTVEQAIIPSTDSTDETVSDALDGAAESLQDPLAESDVATSAVQDTPVVSTTTDEVESDQVAEAASSTEASNLEASKPSQTEAAADSTQVSPEAVTPEAVTPEAVTPEAVTENAAIAENDGSSDQVRFADLGLNDRILSVLTDEGYEFPTPIQAGVIPVVLEGKDLVGQASTGTGKTAAFALPVLERLANSNNNASPMAIVLVPTRELAMQVSTAFETYAKNLRVKVLPVFGGTPIGRQLQALRRGVDVVVATPGRALDLIKRRALDLSEVEVVILDEADEMFEMGFAEDIESLLSETSADRQTVLLSATMPARINGMVKRHLNDPVKIQIKVKKQDGDGPKIRQMAYVVPGSHKTAALGRLLDSESPTAAIVFCRTRDEVDSVAESLNGWGYRAEALHGGMSQEHRDRVMRRLRSKTADLLVATDVAARGLDIDHLSHVVNYDVPTAPESYVHRIGRVGRAGREGVALTIVEPRNKRRVANIERLTKVTMTVAKVPTVKDLNKKRLQATETEMANIIGTAKADSGASESGNNSDAEAIINGLMAEHDLMDIALAAVKKIHASSGRPTDDVDIPDVSNKFDRSNRRDKDGGQRGGQGGQGGERRPFTTNADTAKIFIGAGRAVGVRPQDLVGAIAGETHLSGRDIGPIQISERFSIVGVPKESADQVVSIMRNASVKGKKVTVKIDTGSSSGGGGGGGGHKSGGYKGKRNSKPWEKGGKSNNKPHRKGND